MILIHINTDPSANMSGRGSTLVTQPRWQHHKRHIFNYNPFSAEFI